MNCNSKTVWCRIKGAFSSEKSHAWFHTALIWCGAQWECEGVPGTGIESFWQQHTTVSHRQQWVADMLMDDVWKCEKEISHRQELAGVLFSRSVSNGFLIRVKPSWWAISQIEISFSFRRTINPDFEQIYCSPAPGLLFAGQSRGLSSSRVDSTARFTDQRCVEENKGPELSQAVLGLLSNSSPFGSKMAVINATAPTQVTKVGARVRKAFVFALRKEKRRHGVTVFTLYE